MSLPDPFPTIELPADAGFRVDLTRSIQRWNQEHLLDFSFGPIPIDWIKALLPAFQRILQRARWEEIGGRRSRVADAEGLLLLKLIAFRPRDQEDIRGILAANPGTLDLDWVRREWSALSTPDDTTTGEFEQLVKEFYRSP